MAAVRFGEIVMDRELHPVLAIFIFLVVMFAIFGFVNWFSEKLCEPVKRGPWELLAEGRYAGHEIVVGSVNFGSINTKVNTKITFMTGQSIVISGEVLMFARLGNYIKVYKRDTSTLFPEYDIQIVNHPERK